MVDIKGKRRRKKTHVEHSNKMSTPLHGDADSPKINLTSERERKRNFCG